MPAIRRARHVMPKVKSFDDMVALALWHGNDMGTFNQIEVRADLQPRAEINTGRWLVRCPVCNNGIPADPDWSDVVCVECGSQFAPIYPNEGQRVLIERLLEPRPVANQNWLPHESLTMLRHENRQHHIEVEEI